MWLYPTNITYFRRYTPFGADPMAEHGPWRPYQPRFQKPSIYFAISENSNTFALPIGRTILPPARMAESVDALVSNTSGAIRAGSIPAPGTSRRVSIALGLLCLYPLLNPTQLRWQPLSGSRVVRKQPSGLFQRAACGSRTGYTDRS